MVSRLQEILGNVPVPAPATDASRASSQPSSPAAKPEVPNIRPQESALQKILGAGTTVAPSAVTRTSVPIPEFKPVDATTAGPTAPVITPTPLQQKLGVTSDTIALNQRIQEQKQRILAEELAKLQGKPEYNTFARGIQAGIIGVKEATTGLNALGASVFRNEEELTEAADTFARLGAQREILQPRLPTVRDLLTRDDATFADFAEWATFSIGEQLPNIATVFAGGGLGGFFGKTLGKLAAKKIITDIEQRALLRKFTNRGAATAAYAAATGLETGATTQEQLEATGKINPVVSVAAGGIKGALEIATPAAIATRFGITEQLGSKFYNRVIDKLSKGGLVRRTTGGALALSAGESVTEGMQETVDLVARDFVDENFKLMSTESAWRILNSAALGGLVGGVAGGVTGLATKPITEQKALSLEELEKELKTPTPQFQMPGAYVIGDPNAVVTEDTGGAPKAKVFTPGFEAQTTPGAKEKGIYQVDLAQVPVEALSARLEDLPGAGVIHEGNNAALPLEVHDFINKAINLRDRAEKLQFLGDDAEGRVRNQEQARKMLELAQAQYEAAIDLGFRYIPEGGIAELQQKGMTLPTGLQLPPTAFRQVDNVEAVFDPRDMISLNSKQGKANGGIYEGMSRPSSRADAFVLRSELREDQVSTRELPPAMEFKAEDIRFAPYVNKEQQQKLIEKAATAVTLPYSDRNVVYKELLREGFRYKPSETERTFYVLDIKPRPVPGQLYDNGTAGLVRAARALDFYGDLSDENIVEGFEAKEYDLSSHKKGEVVVLGANQGSPLARELGKKAADILRQLVKRMMPDMRMVLDLRPYAPQSYIGSYASYLGENKDGGLARIFLAPDIFRDESRLMFVLSHEFGHILSGHVLKKADAKTQSAIFTSWLRHLYAQQRQGASEFWLAFSSSGRLVTYPDHFSGNRNAAQVIAADEGFRQWYQFDEYFAESTAKWMLEQGSSARTLAESFFKNLADLLLKAWEFVQQKFGQDPSPVDEAVRDYLEEVYRRGEEMVQQPAVAVAGLYEQVVDPKKEPGWANDPYKPTGFDGVLMRAGMLPAHARGADKYAWYVKWGWNVLQLAIKNPHIEGLQKYVAQVRLWHQEKMQWISRADERVVAWRNLGKEMGQRLGDFIWELETMPYLKPGEKPRKPTDPELVALAAKHKLSHDAIALWREIDGDFSAILDRIEWVWLRDAAAIQDPVELAKTIANIKKEILALRSRPYYPHARFGDWTLTVRDPIDNKLKVFRQFENKRAQEAAFKQAEQDFPGMDIQMGKMDEEMQVFRGLPSGFLDNIASKMQLTQAQRDVLEQIKFDMSPANSWAKHLKKRKGVPGWSTDAMRSYGNYFFHAAHHIARIVHRPALELAIAETKQSRTGLVDARKLDQIVSYLNRHLQYILYPPNELSAIRSLGATWLLGFAPDSAFINFTQVPLVAAPYLSSRFNDASAIAALMRASKDLWKLYNSKGHAANIEQDVYDAQQLGIEQGVIDQSFAAELAATAHGSGLSRFVGGSALERMVSGLGRAAMFMFRTTEKINRVVVFDAAYKLGRAQALKGGSSYINELLNANPDLVTDLDINKGWQPEHIAGFLVARDAVERTMFEYSQWARPEFMRGKKGALFTFFMFMQNMLWFARYSPGNKRYLALLLAASGMMGLPLAEDLNDIMKVILSKIMGKYFDPEAEVRKLVAELGADPTLVARGFGANTLGLQALGEMTGIPIPGIDISRRMGMGRIVPGVEPLTMLGASWEDRIARVTEDVLGASYGIPYNLVQAVHGFEPDNFKSYERLIPRAFKNAARGLRWGLSGEETAGSGAVLREFDPEDPLSLAEAVLGTAGFMPSALTQKWDNIRAKQEVEMYWKAQKGILYDQFWRAAKARDREALADARDNIKKYNKWVPEPGLKIRADDLRQSVSSRRQSVLREEKGLSQQKRLTRTVRQVDEAFPLPSQ